MVYAAVVEAVGTRPERHQRWSDERRTVVAAGVALVLQVLFILLIGLALKAGPAPHKPVVKQAVSMRTISRSDWESNRVTHPSSAAARALKPLPPKPEPRPQGQVVDVAPGNGKVSSDSKYLAETSNTVQKETRAKETTPFYGTAMPRTTATVQNPAAKANQPIPEQKKGNHGKGHEDHPESAATTRTAARQERVRAQRKDLLAMRSNDQSGLGPLASRLLNERLRIGGSALTPDAQPTEASDSEHAASDGREGTDTTTHSEPSSAVTGPVAGAAANDALRDVPIGDGTFLNTREWKFAGFMNRVKQSVGAHWDPQRVLERHRSAGAVFERNTILAVVLNGEGGLADVKVAKSCGDESLDSEAVAAFERSQPFPNPPHGLVESDGTIRFNFGFLLDLNGGAQFRGFRLHD